MIKNLLTVQHWNSHEIRMEIHGNGCYILKENLADFIKANATKLAAEILFYAGTTETIQ